MSRRLPFLLAVIVVAVTVPAPARANGVQPPGEGACQVPVPFPEPRPVPLAQGTGASVASTTEPIVVPEGHGSLVAAGDLDGDGLDEAIERLEVYVGDRSFVRLSAVDGNGATMWSRDGSHAEVIPIGNLDGAPGDDLLTLAFEYQPAPGAFIQSLVVTALRGTDGAELWTRRFDGANTGVSVGSSGSYIDAGTTYPRSVARDADGDGAPDLLLARHHAAFIADETTKTYSGANAAVFQLISGRTGSVLSLFATPDPRSVTDATTVSDLSGDGLDDVVVISSPTTEERRGEQPATLAAYSGRGLPLWRSEIRTLGYPTLIGSALDGDDRSDVLVQSVDFDPRGGEPGPTGLVAISGKDGSSLWMSIVSGYADMRPAGDATKDGGSEILTFAHEIETHKPNGSRATVSLLRGSDGRPLWSRTLEGPRYVADATGDGVTDVLTAHAVGRGRNARVGTELLNGASGRRTWRRDGPRSKSIGELGGDLNGDRAGDLVVWAAAGARQRFNAISGKSGRNLWAKPVEVDGDLFMLDAANLRSRARADVLESRTRREPNRSILTRALSGRDGRQLWQRSFPLGGAPRPR